MWKTLYCYPVKCYTPMDSVLACIFTSFCLLPFMGFPEQVNNNEMIVIIAPKLREPLGHLYAFPGVA
jgi:hypothetical protein